MKCPECGNERTSVENSRYMNVGFKYRRRLCKDCFLKFTTYEMPEEALHKMIQEQARELAKEMHMQLMDKFFANMTVDIGDIGTVRRQKGESIVSN